MKKKKTLKILFIGNSHTYYNDMPLMVWRRAEDEGYECHVTLIAHPGWFLSQHMEEPDVRFNILFGRYDYVVLQEHAHPFGPEDEFRKAAGVLTEWIREGGSIPVICETWAEEVNRENQDHMNKVHQEIASETGALLAPVGEYWWDYKESWPDLKMYADDGEHASEAGSEFAAKYIWETIRGDITRRELEDERNH